MGRAPKPISPSLAGTVAAIAGTRAFQQAALFVAAVVVAGAVVMWLLLDSTNNLVSRQIVATLAADAEGVAGIADVAGATAAIEAVAKRLKDGAGRIYLLESSIGTKLAGNLDRWPADLQRAAPQSAVGATSGGTFEYKPEAGGDARRLAAGVTRKLAGDMNLLVGRDLAAQQALAATFRWLFLAGFGALALAGLVAGVVTSRLALGRVGEITRTSDEIMAGDFSRRIPLTGSGDELDHLAGNLNDMLDRIENLMAGLREVSDNIAHDLKTPLTRLRARAEAAQRGGAEHHSEGLGHIIEDADELIKTFNALLLIARLEAGALDATTETFDLSALARDVAELYEPVAEDAGMTLTCAAATQAVVRANRQLIGQAIANLIDNAIKYGRPSSAVAPQPDLTLAVRIVDNEVLLSIADRGPGIPAADHERVLKRFVRLEASRTRPGTGLGLSLVAAVARLNGGRLLLEDHAPGLRVVVGLPLHPA